MGLWACVYVLFVGVKAEERGRKQRGWRGVQGDGTGEVEGVRGSWFRERERAVKRESRKI